MRRSRTSIVKAVDGTGLAVREIGDASAPLTLMFLHGFCLKMDVWLPQSVHLEQKLGGTARMVFYDHRGHGASDEPKDPRTYTLEQLGDDLGEVIAAVAPRGPVILVGHSMGGMALLAYAAKDDDVMSRIAGVGLISTAACDLAKCGVGRMLGSPAIPLLHLAARRAPALTSQVWDYARNGVAPLVGFPITNSPTLQANQACCRMIGRTPIAAIAALLAAFRSHDQLAALSRLKGLPALVACGEADQITPMRHSVKLHEHLPNSEFLRVPRAGHMLGLERPRLVSDAVSRLVSRAAAFSAAAAPA